MKKTQVPTQTLLLMRDALRAAGKALRKCEKCSGLDDGGVIEIVQLANDEYTAFQDARAGKLHR